MPMDLQFIGGAHLTGAYRHDRCMGLDVAGQALTGLDRQTNPADKTYCKYRRHFIPASMEPLPTPKTSEKQDYSECVVFFRWIPFQVPHPCTP